uniref:Uncharacterized protein n=1 Tax=Rhizoctonia solani TaxID=456999 RepID=N0A3B8_9AGAM|nr:hypothetical protein RSOL_m01610 [Rhizoctonia solani]AGK45469.1 hypothetical protein RSOL_m01610 [Rhizoctonia solani]
MGRMIDNPPEAHTFRKRSEAVRFRWFTCRALKCTTGKSPLRPAGVMSKLIKSHPRVRSMTTFICHREINDMSSWE